MYNKNIGIDGVHCTIILNKQVQDGFRIDKNLKNSDGSIYGSVKSYGENIKLRFNVPLMLRDNNYYPFSMEDMDQIPYIKTKLLTDLNDIFGTKIKEIRPNAIEVNVTKELKETKVSTILDLVKSAYLDNIKQTAMWQIKGNKINEARNVGVLTYNLQNEYRLKCYDKTEQMKSKMINDLIIEGYNDDDEVIPWENNEEINRGKSVGKQWESKRWENGGKLLANKIPKNSIRIEMIMQGRRIRHTYGKNCQLFQILDNLPLLIDLFVVKYEKEVLKRIEKYVKEIKMEMFEELTEGKSVSNVISDYYNVLYDSKQIQAMMQRYYQFKGYEDQSERITKNLSKKFGIKTGCFKEIKNMLK